MVGHGQGIGASDGVWSRVACVSVESHWVRNLVGMIPRSAQEHGL